MFSKNTQVLLANGEYKVINSLAPCTDGFAEKWLELRYSNWYEPICCTDNVKFLVKKDSETMQWVLAKDLTVGTVLVDTINHCKELFHEVPEPLSYDYGLMVGLYIGYGCLIDGKVEFHFGSNKELAQDLQTMLQTFFAGATAEIEEHESGYRVKTDHESIVSWAKEFGPKMTRTVPEKYWLLNSDFLSGIFEGLTVYNATDNSSFYIPASESVALFFLYISTILELSVDNLTSRGAVHVYPMIVNHDQSTQTCVITSINHNVPSDQQGFKIESKTDSVTVNRIVCT